MLHALLGDSTTLSNQFLVVTAWRSEYAGELDIEFEHQHIGFLEGDVMLAPGYQAEQDMATAKRRVLKQNDKAKNAMREGSCNYGLQM